MPKCASVRADESDDEDYMYFIKEMAEKAKILPSRLRKKYFKATFNALVCKGTRVVIAPFPSPLVAGVCNVPHQVTQNKGACRIRPRVGRYFCHFHEHVAIVSKVATEYDADLVPVRVQYAAEKGEMVNDNKDFNFDLGCDDMNVDFDDADTCKHGWLDGEGCQRAGSHKGYCDLHQLVSNCSFGDEDKDTAEDATNLEDQISTVLAHLDRFDYFQTDNTGDITSDFETADIFTKAKYIERSVSKVVYRTQLFYVAYLIGKRNVLARALDVGHPPTYSGILDKVRAISNSKEAIVKDVYFSVNNEVCID